MKTYTLTGSNRKYQSKIFILTGCNKEYCQLKIFFLNGSYWKYCQLKIFSLVAIRNIVNLALSACALEYADCSSAEG